MASPSPILASSAPVSSGLDVVLGAASPSGRRAAVPVAPGSGIIPASTPLIEPADDAVGTGDAGERTIAAPVGDRVPAPVEIEGAGELVEVGTGDREQSGMGFVVATWVALLLGGAVLALTRRRPGANDGPQP